MKLDNQNILLLIIAFLLGLLLMSVSIPFLVKNQQQNLGFGFNEPTFSKVTNASSSCGTVAMEVVATTTGRTSFTAFNTSGTVAYLCRTASSSCSLGIGIPLYVSATLPYTQNDGYVGPYSCISTTVSSTISTTHSL